MPCRIRARPCLGLFWRSVKAPSPCLSPDQRCLLLILFSGLQQSSMPAALHFLIFFQQCFFLEVWRVVLPTHSFALQAFAYRLPRLTLSGPLTLLLRLSTLLFLFPCLAIFELCLELTYLYVLRPSGGGEWVNEPGFILLLSCA